jgi:hypothetical protein
VPFLNFSGSSYPATGINLSVNNIQGACWSGSNFQNVSFTYSCSGVSPSGNTTSQTQLNGGISFVNSASGVYGNLYYNGGWKYYQNGAGGAVIFGASSGAHSIDFLRATNNGSGQNAVAGPVTAAYFDQYGQMFFTNYAFSNGWGAQTTYVVSGLGACSSSNAGMMEYVTDLTAPTYNGTLTGGGNVGRWVTCTSSAGTYAWRS